MSDPVRVERNGPVTTVIIDRPAARNAVNGPTAAALFAAFADFDRDDGASVAVGGDSPSSSGYYVNPTILVDVKPTMSVVREEIFGPVVVAQRFDDLDEVARLANDTAYGLGAGIWTRDVSVMHKLASKIKAGTVWGNCHALIDPALPFGGFKQSGFGREQARQGIEMYTELKTVIIKL